MKVLTFKVWAPYGHFRRPYTTRSPVTFTIPPRPTILGLVGAILGMSKEEYPTKLASIKVGVRVDSEIRKIKTTINLLDTKEKKMVQRTQILYELLSYPQYTIALHGDDEIIDRTYNAIKEQSPYYTPYLGTAQHIARIYDPKITEERTVERVRTNFVAPLDSVLGAETKRTYIVERQAYHIDPGRIAMKYIDVAIPVGGSITVVRNDVTIPTEGGIVLW